VQFERKARGCRTTNNKSGLGLASAKRRRVQIILIIKEVIRKRYENGMERPAKEGDSPVS
jgi:hypothetical protein